MPTYTTNPDVKCRSCQERPVLVIDGKQRERCAICQYAIWDTLGGLWSDITYQLAAQKLMEALEKGEIK